MAYTVVNVEVIDQTLQVTNLPKLASGGDHETQIRVSFCEMWASYGKTAVFYREKKGFPVYHVVMVDDACLIPREVMAEPGKVYFAILGVSGETTRTTEAVALTVERGVVVTAIPVPLPDIYKQLMSCYGEVSANIETERKRIDNLIASGSTDYAEVVDIRVAHGGETHSSAGGAVRAQIKTVLGAVSADLTFEQGSIASADGTNTDNVTNRIRTGFILADTFNKVSVGTGFIVTMFQYTADLGYISTTNWSASGGKFDRSKLDSACRYIRFAVARSSAADLDVATETGFAYVSTMDSVDFELDYLHKMMVADVVFTNGTLNATTGVENSADTRIRTDFLPPRFERVTINPGYYLNLFQYDKNYAFLESTDFVTEIDPAIIREDCAYIRFVVRRISAATITPADETGFALYRSDLSVYALDSKIAATGRDYHCRKYNSEIMNTAYSTIGLAPINTAEHFHLAAHLGFNALKGDVRITADNKLVMCHDAGLTLDDNGRIVAYDATDALPILESNYATLMQLEHATHYAALGHYAKMCDFDTFIRICKETGKIAYITLRENNIVPLVSAVMDTLKKYRMESHCVINSYTIATLREVRKYSDIIPLSMVIALGATLTTETVDKVIPLGNAMVTMFLYPTDNPLELWNQSADALTYAQENDVQIHMAQVDSRGDYYDMIQRGVQGFHLTRPILEYLRKDIQFTVTVESGKAWFGNILGSDRLAADIAMTDGVVTLSNIAVNGSGYGYDDGLPKLWLNKLPCTASVFCSSNPACTARIQNGAVVIDTSVIDGTYYVNVNI